MDDTYDTGDVKSVKKRKTKFQLAQERNNEELKKLVDSDAGAYLIWRVLKECGIYTHAPDDSQLMAIHEGKRRIGQWLLTELVSVDEKLYSTVRNIGSLRDNGE